jgi:hypothetical protein
MALMFEVVKRESNSGLLPTVMLNIRDFRWRNCLTFLAQHIGERRGHGGKVFLSLSMWYPNKAKT